MLLVFVWGWWDQRLYQVYNLITLQTLIKMKNLLNNFNFFFMIFFSETMSMSDDELVQCVESVESSVTYSPSGRALCVKTLTTILA